MKQTAVEWLIEEYFGGMENCTPDFRYHIEQAKEMEKEQIIEAYLKNHLQGCWMKNTPEEYAEQYYNETYESKTNI
jgi:hypothetical protein